MLDIKFVRENPDAVKKGLEKRQDTEKAAWVDDLIEKDKEYRNLLQLNQDLRHKKNIVSEEINKLKKEGKDISGKIVEIKELPLKIKEVDDKINEMQNKVHYYLMRLPNILHKSVPFGKDSNENKEVRKWGEKKKFNFELKPHGELIEKKGLANFDDAAKVSGKGFYYLMGNLALMELALQRFALDILVKKGYTVVEPPFMMRREPYEGVTDLADFETMMYKVEGENEDLYLIATSEHPIGAMMMNKVLEEKDMPLKFCGVSSCFRKEIGSHGIDEKGLFRVHQFNKIEQFIFCKPEDSWKFHEELIANAENIFQKLKLPYRVVNICTGDIGIVAAKKYDLEAWMPRENTYKEVVSCSNCTSYQAVRLNIKYKNGEEKEYIHTLNSTAIATGRALRAIIENYQQKDGSIKVPAALVPYMNGVKVI
ncbi:MAG: serine--tRNA ligase [Nanoarchaeota archaeon]|nr:serine--tRNA ligase [Nanoarchaeota archaeon]MBU1005274.1 serine--tRNA ligase [Nanoarchaeota archaeon]MBU1947011.1 serine--tRNA ligase [Nanoarchaeota archaeon]